MFVRDYLYGLVLKMVDISLLHIFRFCDMVFPRCKVAWKHSVFVCTRTKDETVC